MSASAAIYKKTIELVQKICTDAGVNIVIDTDTRLGDLSLDSLKLVEVIYELEKHYSVQADEDLLMQLATVGDIAAMTVEAVAQHSLLSA